ncbi:GntR family transcriptional regulator [Paenirhodobacter sp.]|uniref:GntR family transcriptional regulator n=1 Tax=Paenirhodobacter sp. TaxID=1965326 RepID=UPI003B5062EC
MGLDDKAPAHLNTYLGIRELILCGDLVPGQPVTIQGLVGTLNAGMTPVREALRRLTAEGALRFHDNRRITVPVLTIAEVDELIFARLALEPELARRGAARMRAPDIARLEEIDQHLDRAMQTGNIRDYMLFNHRFHAAIYAAAGTVVIEPLVDALWLRSAPALRVMCARFGAQSLPDMHRAALTAMRAGDAAAVAEAIRADILQGLENVRALIAEGAPLV